MLPTVRGVGWPRAPQMKMMQKQLQMQMQFMQNQSQIQQSAMPPPPPPLARRPSTKKAPAPGPSMYPMVAAADTQARRAARACVSRARLGTVCMRAAVAAGSASSSRPPRPLVGCRCSRRER